MEHIKYYTLDQAVACASIPLGAHPNDSGDHTSSLRTNRYALEMLAGGWKDHPPAFDIGISGVKTEKTDVSWHPDVTGEEVDIGAFLAHEPECYLDPRINTVPGEGLIVELVYSTARHNQITSGAIERRGRAVMGLIEGLESSGKAVALTSCGAVSSGRDKIAAIVRIKEPWDYIDKNRLAFVAMNDDYHSGIIWRLREQFPAEVKYECGPYANPIDLEPEYFPSPCLYIPSVDSKHFRDDESTIEWLRAALTKQGVSLAE